MSNNGMSNGTVVAVRGGVVDVEFSTDGMPEIYEAIEIDMSWGRLVLEVQTHLGDSIVRAVAMDTTDGLRRGQAARATGAPDHGSRWPGFTWAHLQRAGRSDRRPAAARCRDDVSDSPPGADL